MAGKLSTHVLDLVSGRPAPGMKIELWYRESGAQLLKTVTTNADGRTEAPLLAANAMIVGRYEMVYYVREYFLARKVACEFLDRVPIAFEISSPDASYHVPLLVTPWAYQTYRGS